MAILDIVALNPATPRLEVPQVGDVYGLGRNLDGQDYNITNVGTVEANIGTFGAITGLDALVAATAAVTANTAKLTANTANVTAAGALMDSEVASLVGVKAMVIPNAMTIESAALPFLAATTKKDQRFAVEVNGSWVHLVAQNGKIGIIYTGQSQVTNLLGTVSPAYVPNPKVKVYRQTTGTWPQSTNTSDYSRQTADTSFASGYVDASIAFIGGVDRVTYAAVDYDCTNAGYEAADIIQKATGCEVELFVLHKSGNPISEWLTGGACRTRMATHVPHWLGLAGLTHAQVMIWDQGNNDATRAPADYVADLMDFKGYAEGQGWIDVDESLWLICELSRYPQNSVSYPNINKLTTNYWSGMQECVKRIGGQAKFISSGGLDTTGSIQDVHFSGLQQRTRAQHMARAIMEGPKDVEPIIQDMYNMSWLRGTTSHVVDGASAVGFDLQTAAALSTSGAKLMRVRNLSTERLSLTHDGLLTTTNMATGVLTANSATVPVVNSAVADGASAIAHTLNTTTNYANATAKLLSIQNNSDEKVYVDRAGNMGLDGELITPSLLTGYLSHFTPLIDIMIQAGKVINHNIASTSNEEIHVLKTSVDVTASGSKLLVVKNNTTNKLTLDKDGILALTGQVTGPGTFLSTVADGASSKAFIFNTPAYSTAGSKIASFQNNGTEAASIYADGQLFASNFASDLFKTGLAYVYGNLQTVGYAKSASVFTGFVTKTASYTSTDTDFTVQYTSGTNTHTMHKCSATNKGQIVVLVNSSGNNLSFATTSGDAITGGVLPTDQVRWYQSNGVSTWVPIAEYS